MEEMMWGLPSRDRIRREKIMEVKVKRLLMDIRYHRVIKLREIEKVLHSKKFMNPDTIRMLPTIIRRSLVNEGLQITLKMKFKHGLDNT